MDELLDSGLAIGVRLELAYAALGVRLELGELPVFYESSDRVSTIWHFTLGTLCRKLYSHAEFVTHFRGVSHGGK
jgi:hypothetical protein